MNHWDVSNASTCWKGRQETVSPYLHQQQPLDQDEKKVHFEFSFRVIPVNAEIWHAELFSSLNSIIRQLIRFIEKETPLSHLNLEIVQKHSHPTEYFEVLEPGSVELMNLRNMERWILRPVKIEMIVRVRNISQMSTIILSWPISTGTSRPKISPFHSFKIRSSNNIIM